MLGEKAHKIHRWFNFFPIFVFKMQVVDIPLMLNFHSCLIHYINYEYLDIPPPVLPIIITKYNFEDDSWCHTQLELSKFSKFFQKYYSRLDKKCHKYNQALNLLKILNIVTKTKWTCLAQLYLYPVAQLFEPTTLENNFDILEYYYNFGVDSTENYGSISTRIRTIKDESNKMTVTSRNAYRFLVSREVTSLTDWTNWSIAMDKSVRKYFSTYLFQVVTKAYFSEVVKVSISCLVCDPFSNPLEEILISDMNISFFTIIYRMNFLHRNSIPISFRSMMKHNTPTSHMIWITETSEEVKSQDVEVSRMLYRVVFPNYTETQEPGLVWGIWTQSHDKTNENACFGSVLTFLAKHDLSSNVRVIWKHNAVSYLTCFDSQHEGISFKGFLSAFDVYTWLCIVTVSFTAVGLLLLGLCSTNFEYSIDLRDFTKPTAISKVSLALVGILLEQGQHYINWTHKNKGCSILLIVPALFGGLIISNAYKGENINQITAPFSQAKYDTLDAIIRTRFKVYSSAMSGDMGSNFTLLNEILREIKKGNAETKVTSKLQHLSDIQIRFKQQLILCYSASYMREVPEKMRRFNEKFRHPNILSYSCTWKGTVLHKLTKCDNVAYFEDDEFIKLYLLPALKYTGKESALYNVGQEKFPQALFGTTFYNVRFPGIEERLHLALSSGILAKLYATYEENNKRKFYTTVHTKSREREEDNESTEYFENGTLWGLTKLKEYYHYFMNGKSTRNAASLTIQGNVISLFVASCTLIFVASVVLAFEIGLYRLDVKQIGRQFETVLYQFHQAAYDMQAVVLKICLHQ